MKPKLLEMVRSIRSALEDESCKKEAEDLLCFVNTDLISNSRNRSLAWRIVRETGKAKPRAIRETISCFDPSNYEPLEKAAKILGVRVELLDEPPF